MTLTTHVLDTSRGAPAEGILIELFAVDGDVRRRVAATTTNSDGRTDAPLAASLVSGIYEVVFNVESYFEKSKTATLFDSITVRVRIDAEATHYHVPLLLAPWAYSTYRGS